MNRLGNVDSWRGNFGTPKVNLHKELARLLCWAHVEHYYWEVKSISTRRGQDRYSAPRYSLKVWGKMGTFPTRSEHGLHVRSWKRGLYSVEYTFDVVDGVMGTPIKALFLET